MWPVFVFIEEYIYIYIYIYVCVCVCVCVCVFTNFSSQAVTQSQFLSGVYQVWIQNVPSPRPVVKPGLKSPVCSTIAGGKIVEFIPFPSVLALS